MKEKESSKKAVVILILITSVVLLGIGSYFIVDKIMNKNGENTEVNNSTND